jgi:hypothetical protein
MSMNKTTKVLSLATVMIAMTGMMGLSFDQVFADKPGNGAGGVGKGGYQLNLIGQDAAKGEKKLGEVDDGSNNGHRIFIPLEGNTRILLTEGDFGVIDYDGLDGRASFSLPAPNTSCAEDDLDPETECAYDADYQVFIRVLGKPSNSLFAMNTCAYQEEINPVTGQPELIEVCSTEEVSVTSSNGKGNKAKFENVSRELLTACMDVAEWDPINEEWVFDGVCDIRVDIFSDEFVDYFWKVINDNKRLVQLRFIQS